MLSVRSSVVLLFMLFVPFLLKYLGEEPYPAVLLPAYPQTITKSEYLTVKNTSLFGVDNNGVWEEIDKRAFFDPIPLERANTILADDLGLAKPAIGTETKKSAFYRKLGIYPGRSLTIRDLRELKNWIQLRLASQHLSTSKVRIVVFNNTVAIKSGLVINTEIKSEKVYLLN